MKWEVVLEERVVDDLRWFGRKNARVILNELLERLQQDPLGGTKRMKSLRPNDIAGRQLSLMGRFRVLFNVDAENHRVAVVLVGEKKGERLHVRGEEFTKHHESDSIE